MDEVVVETRYGPIQGMQEGPLQVFRGIPFAKPPIGPLRLRPPEPPEPWSGIRDATAFGPSPMQASSPFIRITSTSEDCLYLNVWTPRADDARRPVMVYIYGGRFISGSASEPQYNGSAFAQDGDLVVVTLNYRLGALGFLYLGDLLGEDYADSGNCGLLDIIAALQWVREHIADFGGDPSQVTIMGQSSGAMCVATLLAMPAVRGLFGRALLESGAGQTTRDTKTATRTTRRFLSMLKVVPNEARTLLESSCRRDDRSSVQGIRWRSDSVRFRPCGGWLFAAPVSAGCYPRGKGSSGPSSHWNKSG